MQNKSRGLIRGKIFSQENPIIFDKVFRIRSSIGVLKPTKVVVWKTYRRSIFLKTIFSLFSDAKLINRRKFKKILYPKEIWWFLTKFFILEELWGYWNQHNQLNETTSSLLYYFISPSCSCYLHLQPPTATEPRNYFICFGNFSNELLSLSLPILFPPHTN